MAEATGNGSLGEVTYLTGHLLIAMPAMADPNFVRSVTYICEHSDQGALGIVINRPLDMALGEVFQQLALEGAPAAVADQPVLRGGPVQGERGFVLHDGDHAFDSSLEVADGLYLTTSRDVLEAMARGDGPKQALVALGCAGWGEGQLEQELVDDSWLLVPNRPDVLFQLPIAQRWQAAAGSIGIDLLNHASHSGHA